ncbi:hypothetical protein [Streptomyces sp. NPDC056132]|uniref:hypothetical protein n=1 Tax=Streptomyces sp. NPDC056132 TaxID=3345722 RepID=UPI0035D69BF4
MGESKTRLFSVEYSVPVGEFIVHVDTVYGKQRVFLNENHPLMRKLLAYPEDLQSMPQENLAVLSASMEEAFKLLFLAWGEAISNSTDETVEVVKKFQMEWAKQARILYGEHLAPRGTSRE